MDPIEDILERSVANIIPSQEKLRELLKTKKINVYYGIDPTSPSIHLGHAVALRKLQKLLDLGHNITFLIGDFTALVGDTSDKESERPILTSEEIEKNFQAYKSQAEKFLDFSKIKLVHNSSWLSKLTFKELIHIIQQFSLNDFISRELIRKRLEEGKRVRLDETIYPLMQGYDSYHLDTDLQIGGTDQTFNMQAGRTLIKNLRNKESFVITNEFLSGTDGRKMSKSWGNSIWINDSPADVYGKVMSLKDELITEYYTLGTNLSLSEVNKISKELKTGTNPMQIKKTLAFQITKELHDEQKALDAAKHFESFYQKDEPENFTPSLATGKALDIFAQLDPTRSRSDIRRLIDQGAATINDSKITDPQQEVVLMPGTTITLGRHIKKIVK